jgi:hypothetical protein
MISKSIVLKRTLAKKTAQRIHLKEEGPRAVSSTQSKREQPPLQLAVGRTNGTIVRKTRNLRRASSPFKLCHLALL